MTDPGVSKTREGRIEFSRTNPDDPQRRPRREFSPLGQGVRIHLDQMDGTTATAVVQDKHIESLIKFLASATDGQRLVCETPEILVEVYEARREL